jgi:hypothetical protein
MATDCCNFSNQNAVMFKILSEKRGIKLLLIQFQNAKFTPSLKLQLSISFSC